MQDDRSLFNLTHQGNIKINKYVKENNQIINKTMELQTSMVGIKDNHDEETFTLTQDLNNGTTISKAAFIQSETLDDFQDNLSSTNLKIEE